jgi:hypothetical protein
MTAKPRKPLKTAYWWCGVRPSIGRCGYDGCETLAVCYIEIVHDDNTKLNLKLCNCHAVAHAKERLTSPA